MKLKNKSVPFSQQKTKSIFGSPRILIQCLITSLSIILIVAVLNGYELPAFMNTCFELLRLNQIGSPTGWINESVVFRAEITDVYYIAFTSTVLTFFANIGYKVKLVVDNRGFWQWLGIILFTFFGFFMCYFWFYVIGDEYIATVEQLNDFRKSKYILNTTLGLLLLTYMNIEISRFCSKCTHWVFSRVVCFIKRTVN